MSSKKKFVALVSGGKDSVFAICEAEKYGHELVVCATLAPASEREQDSWMYQSAGHGAVSCVAECLGVPLVRRTTRGVARSTALVYAKTEGDEVEDLRSLLAEVKAAYPTVDAACCGAVWSNYQRTRVEDVCEGLGLVSLSYLWMRPQRPLLEEICLHVDAILVKTASMGLREAHLGARLRDLKPLFRSLHDQFGFHECGEGGEYETLVLDSTRFRHKRVVLDEVRPVFDDNGDDCGVLDIIKCHTEPKGDVVRFFCDDNEEEQENDGVILEDDVRVDSDVEEDDSDDREDDVESSDGKTSSSEATTALGRRRSSRRKPVEAERVRLPRWPFDLRFVEAALVSSGAGRVRASALACVRCEGTSVEAALDEALSAVPSVLKARCFFAHLYVSDVGEFAAANRAYARHFCSSSDPRRRRRSTGVSLFPPSRVCVGLASKRNCVAVDLDFVDAESRRSGLHVKSISNWAPVCIGPYCQANVLSKALVFCAGQIALDPPTMALAAEDRLDLCFEHSDAILRACESRLENALCATVYVVDVEAIDDCEWLAANPSAVRVVLQVPALPKGARTEVEVVAATDDAAGLVRRRQVAFDASPRRVTTTTTTTPPQGGDDGDGDDEEPLSPREEREALSWRRRSEGVVTVDASVVPGSLCVASLAVKRTTATVAEAAVELVQAAIIVLRDAAELRYEHWVRLRVFVAPDVVDADQLHECILRALTSVPLDDETQRPRRPPGPAVSVVLVSGFPEQADDVLALGSLFACSLDALEAALWLRE